MAAQRADGGIGEEPVQLGFRAAFRADRLDERQGIANSPDDECRGDDIFLVARDISVWPV